MFAHSIFATIKKIDENEVFAICNDMGYRFTFISNKKLEIDKKYHIFLYCHFQIAIAVKFRYFGFMIMEELNIFQNLQKIPGIGCKYSEVIMMQHYKKELNPTSLEIFIKNPKIYKQTNLIFLKNNFIYN